MKWLAAVLMIVNVVVFLGVSDRQVKSAFPQSDNKPDVNRESMRLLKEVLSVENKVSDDQDFNDREPPTLITAPDIGSESIGEIEKDAASASDTNEQQSTRETPGAVEIGLQGSQTSVASLDISSPPDDFSCYRVGPFKDRSSWGDARQWAIDQELEFTPVRSESRELRAVRVYIGPFAAISAAQQDVNMLDEKELDYFVYLRDNGEARISLGYFTQEELAAKFVDYLSSQNIDAKSQPEYRTLGPYDWMDLRLKSTSRWELLERDWQDEDVKVSERSCTAR
jgi:hypothetical protein